MPLPRNDTAWPPATVHARELAEHAAWYSGDPSKLGGFYGSEAIPRTRPTQLAGGVVGAVSRFFWGQPTPAGEKRAKLHVPLAADLCGTSADLLFSEPLQLSSDNQATAEVLADLQEQGLDAKLHEGAEVQAALGGTYLRTVWDTDVQPLPWTEVAHPTGAVPEFRHGRLAAVTLWTELACEDGGVVWRHLERHEPGVILHGLYKGTHASLGKVQPLQDRPETEYLAERVDETGGEATGLDKRLTVAYVPNMLPNRLHLNSPQGRSDLQGLSGFLDALDEAYSSWWRDIRHAKSRLHLPAQYLQAGAPGEAALADIDRELYVPLEGVMATTGDRLLIDAQQFAIRVEEHKATCEAWTQTIIESAGYSTQSLSSGTGGAVTAAEVHAHERRSFMTRGKKVRYWQQGLRAHLATQLEVAQLIGARGAVGEFSLEFTDGVQESALSLANTALALRNAEAASIDTRVRMIHPDWDDTEVDAEVERIARETGLGAATMPDPDAGL